MTKTITIPRITFLLSLVVMLGLSFGYIVVKIYGDQRNFTSSRSDKMIVSSLRVQKNIPEFTRDVETIIIGTVKEERSASENPKNLLIYRSFALSVNQFLKNSQPANDVVVNIYGGKVGNREMIMEDEPTLAVGERVLLFLALDERTADPSDFIVYAGDYGKFSIDKNGNAIGSENEKRSLVDFTKEIEAHNSDKKLSVPCDLDFVPPQGYSGPTSDDCVKEKGRL